MRTFGANFITQKNANYAKPFIICDFGVKPGMNGSIGLTERTPLGDTPVEINGKLYYPLVTSWGSIGSSLVGFGEAFSTTSTTIQVLNTPSLPWGMTVSRYLNRYPSKIRADLYWVFENPDTGAFYIEEALLGDFARPRFGIESMTVEIVAKANRLLNRDLLRIVDDVPTPLIVNAADKIPMRLRLDDASKLIIGEDIRPAVANYTLGPVYYQGAELTETETAAGNFAPEP